VGDDALSGIVVASIGTTHPWNIAGVGLDARVAAEYHLPQVMAVAGVSAQDAHGLRAVAAMTPDLLQQQLDALPEVSAFRIGALVSAANVRIVARFLRVPARSVPVVVDPVVSVTLGGELAIGDELVETLSSELLRLPVIVTPNIPEIAQLLDLRPRTPPEMTAAGRRFLERGARAAVVKGGHLAGEPVDVAVDRGNAKEYAGARLPGSMRGAGCVFAASLACELALGVDFFGAVHNARAFVRKRIAARIVRGGLQVAF
jgi:hydroxymethylpyrimidine kinase/phosphomethylpyrimidine kinase